MSLPLNNRLVSVVASIAFLQVLGVLWFPVWNYVYSVSVAWVISDFILNLIIRGGRGFAVIPFESEEFVARGRAYLAFFFGIVIGTALSSFLTEWMFVFTGLAVRSIVPTNSTSTPLLAISVIATYPTFFTLLFANLTVGVLVYVDLIARFYGR